jgi:hypothetical protein
MIANRFWGSSKGRDPWDATATRICRRHSKDIIKPMERWASQILPRDLISRSARKAWWELARRGMSVTSPGVPARRLASEVVETLALTGKIETLETYCTTIEDPPSNEGVIGGA